MQTSRFSSALWSKLWAWTEYRPRTLRDIWESLRERVQIQEKNGLRVETAVLNAQESRKMFATSLAARGIQPVWIKISNHTDQPVWFLPLFLDQEYFAPLEAAFLNHWLFLSKRNRAMNDFFREVHLREFIPARGEVSGMVYTHQDSGLKIVNIEMLEITNQLVSFLFFLQVGDMRWDYARLINAEIYEKKEITPLTNDADLRGVLERLPRFVSDQKGSREGDPLNLVFVGTPHEVIGTLIHQGWDETEIIYYGSIKKTIRSYLRRSPYRYSPISSLFAFGRKQDFALQKARKSIVQRNHLRVWMTPYVFQGRPLWLGQISRDIGVRLTSKTWNLTTHVIDPDVDEARNYLVQDLMASGKIAKLGFVQGVGRITPENPQGNLTGDPFYTDGLRAVFILAPQDHPPASLELLPWERLRDHFNN